MPRVMQRLFVVLAMTLLGPLRAAAQTPVTPSEAGFVSLFDGSEETFAQWQVAGMDGFRLQDGAIAAFAADEDMGILYFAPQPFSNFVLRLQFRLTDPGDGSGVHLRFRDLRLPIPPEVLTAPGGGDTFIYQAYYGDNASYPAIDSGYELQIDDTAIGEPDDPSDDGNDDQRTGAIYDVPIGDAPGQQHYQRGPGLVPGRWYDLEITVDGETYTARINGQVTTAFTNTNPLRGRPASEDATSGYIGLESNPISKGQVEFRAIRIQELPS